MYLLDNKTKIDDNILHKIYNIENKENLLNFLNEKEVNGIDFFFDKINFSLNNVVFYKTETTKNNLRKLFLNPPLSMDENSKEFQDIIKKHENDLGMNENNKNLIKDYRILLMEKIKEGKISSYDIVGNVTRNFNDLCYGNSKIKKSDMDLFLFEVSKINPFELNKEPVSFDKKQILNLSNLEKKLNINSMNNNILNNELSVEKRLDDVFNAISSHKSNEIQNLNKILKEHNSNMKKMLFNTFSQLDKEYFKDKASSNPEINNLNVFSKNNIRYKDFKTDFEKFIENSDYEEDKKSYYEKLLNEINGKEEKIKIETMKKIFHKENFSNLFNGVEKNNPLAQFDKKISKVKKYLYDERNDLYKDYKSVKEHYVSITDRYNEYVNVKKEYLLKAFNINKDKSKIGNLIVSLDKKGELLKYDLNDIKQLLYVELSNNKKIYDLTKTTSFFNKIEDNKLLKDILKDKVNENTIPNFNLERVKYVASILINKESLDKLFTNDIRINIKDKFYKVFGTLIEDNLSNSKINEIYKIFNTYKDEKNYKNLNILLGVILESYENKKFNKEKFEQFFEIINTPTSRLNEEQKTIINSIEDKWLKWSVCFNREFKDYILIKSKMNPLDFDFSKMQTIKKVFQNIFKKNNLSTKDYNLIEFLINKDQKESVEEVFLKFKDKINQKKEILNKNWLDEKQFFNMFYRTIDDIVEFKNEIDFKSKIKNIINNFINADKNNINEAFLDVFILNKTLDIVKNINFDKSINFERIFNLVKKHSIELNEGKKDNIINLFNSQNIEKLNKLDILENVFENFKSISSISNTKLENYINYFEQMKKTDSFKNYKEEDSLIPIISKDIGNGYSYKVKTIKEFDILLTGEKTNCCMTYGNAGWNIYKYMYENPKENVIFEVYKDGEPVANSWTWYKDEKICFDNIEVLGKELRDNVIKAYQDAALEFAVNYNIKDVNFGVGHTDIEVNKLGNNINQNIPNKHLNCYNSDSTKQLGVVSLTNNIQNIENSLIKIKDVDSDLLKGYIEKIKNTYNIDYTNVLNLEQNVSIGRNI